MDPEADLIVRMRRGDEVALRDFYDRLSGNVFALARQMLGGAEDAEEVVQDTFVTVYQHADRYDPGKGSARAWTYTIARNACRMRLRARGSRPAKVDAIDLHEPGTPFEAPPGGADPVERLSVQAALARLERDEVAMLTAAFFDGYSHREIADRLDTPLGTVKSRIRRALLKLRDFLDDAPFGDRT